MAGQSTVTHQYGTAVKPAVTPISVVKSAALKFRGYKYSQHYDKCGETVFTFGFQNKGIKNS